MAYLQKLIVFVFTGLLIGFSTNAFSQSQIDVLVLYSNQANSSTNIQSHASQSIASMNESFVNSGLDNVVRVRLVGAKHINKNELSTITDDLNWLKSSSTVASMRNSHYADVVVYIVDHFTINQNGSTVGKATFSGPPSSNRAFAVVSKSFAYNPESYTFAHEIGHIAGLHHDSYNSNYVYKGYQTPGNCHQGPKQFSSIMTQDGSYSTTDANHKLNQWSDPAYEIQVYDEGNGSTDPDDCDNPRECGEGGTANNTPSTVRTSTGTACDKNFGTGTNNSKQGWIDNTSAVASFRDFPTPTNLLVTQGNGFGQPYLTWDFSESSEFDNYNVYRKRFGVHNQNCQNGSLSNYCFIASTTSKNYTDWDVSNSGGTSQTFYYLVTAINNGVESAFSNLGSFDGEYSNFKSNESISKLPSSFELENNYPNPFNPTTTISFALPEQSEVRINVYNVNGQLVSSLINEVRPAGTFDIDFDASGLASGVYIARMVAVEERSGNLFSKNIKMQLVK